ncbi:hypothetical protein L3i22_002210 [Actinoplanes sp. L3-i22]|nr:hypothetical protein L3i22_002210 [Actinoplanes sp. L3-i22]
MLTARIRAESNKQRQPDPREQEKRRNPGKQEKRRKPGNEGTQSETSASQAISSHGHGRGLPRAGLAEGCRERGWPRAAASEAGRGLPRAGLAEGCRERGGAGP